MKTKRPCWLCGKALVNPFGRSVLPGTTRIVDGNPVIMHKVCGESFDNDPAYRRVTAQPEGLIGARGEETDAET